MPLLDALASTGFSPRRNRNPDRNGNRNARAIVPDLRTKRKVSREARSASRGVLPPRRNPHRRNPHRARSVPRNFPRGTRRVRSTPRPLPTLRRTKAGAAARTSSGRARGAASGASRAATRRRTRTRTSRTTSRAPSRSTARSDTSRSGRGPRDGRNRLRRLRAAEAGNRSRASSRDDRRTDLRAREIDGRRESRRARAERYASPDENAHAGSVVYARVPLLIDSRTLPQ